MEKSNKRTYNATSRQTQAQETRRRIVETAKKLFAAKGFESVTIEQLSEGASVSAPTIYALFKSKRGVLRAIIDEALAPEIREKLVEKVKSASSPANRLALAARIARELYDAEKNQMELLRGSSMLHPEFKAIAKSQEKRRYLRQAETIKIMAREKVFVEGITQSKAHDILWALTGRDLYQMLVIERGWSSDSYEDWLAKLLVQTLLYKQGT